MAALVEISTVTLTIESPMRGDFGRKYWVTKPFTQAKLISRPSRKSENQNDNGSFSQTQELTLDKNTPANRPIPPIRMPYSRALAA